MTTTSDSPNPILEAARRLQERKLDAVQDVIDSRAHIAAVQQQLARAERLDALAYAKAVKAGWSADELRQVGIAPPARKAPGRPRSPRSGNSTGNALADAQLQREAEASVALDRDQTHVVGDSSDGGRDFPLAG